MRSSYRILSRLLLLCGFAGPAAAQSDCSHYALVSGYFSNNVHIYDGCSGAFVRLLDNQPGRLGGAQAVRTGPDGALWVVSENTAQVHRYSAEDFSFLSTPVAVGSGFGLTGIDFARDGSLYAGGYSANVVRRYSLEGALLGTPVAANSGVRGIDNGMVFGPDGQLYVPGYDSHNVLRHDPATGQSRVLVGANSSGLRSARGILFRPGGETFLVTGEISGQVLEFRRDNGAFVRELANSLIRPTGLAWAPDGSLAVATQAGVFLIDPDSGARRTLVSAGAGGIGGPTFITFVPKADSTAVDPVHIGSQFWISGAGSLEGKRLVADAVYTSTGASFGADFRPADVVSRRWGAIEVEFTGCTSAVLRWDSSGPDSAGFGQGGYALERFLPGPGTRRCEQQGFAGSAPEDWLQGTWWGGAPRSGEGLLFEYVDDSVVVVTWFTYRPDGH